VVIVLDNWQKEVLNHKGDLLLCTGRRVGKTYIMARKAIDRMIKVPKTQVIMFSLTEDQAMIILSMAKNYLLEAAPNMLVKKHTETNKKNLALKNGSVMRVRPAGDTGDSGRGFEGGILIVDEAARMGKYFWIATLPIILMKAGEIWIASTPFGKQGYFWDRFNEAYNLKDENARFKVFYTTTEQVVEERELTNDWTQAHKEAVKRILDQDKKSMSRLEYGQEYLGLFLEDIMQFFPDDMIYKCQTKKREGGINPVNDYYLGQDIARMGEDETTFEIGYIDHRNKLIHADNLITKQTFLTDTYKMNKELDKQYDFQKIFTDDEGIGVGVFDMLMDDSDTKYKTIGINNSKRVIDADGKEKGILKTDLYFHLRFLLEKGEIELLDDETVFQSLKSVQYEYTTDNHGNPHIKIGGNYTHIAEGLIRLAQATKYKHLNLSVYSIKV
jgi:hypothetical protein